jgi:RsiW-degrading membrane proteinase PrsW (M82 family)
MPVPLTTWQLLGVILASAILWMHYVRLKDRRQPEPPWRLLLAFVLGIVAWAMAVLGFLALDAMGVDDIRFGEARWTAVYCFGIIGPLEEGTKVLLAYLFVFRWREFDEPMDGFVYAAAISLGFASMESFYNLPDLAWQDQLARTVALPITHVMFSAIWGFGIGYARFCILRCSHRALWQIGSIALGMFAHGLYDFLLFAYQATFVTSGLALAIWVFVIWRARAWAKPPTAPSAIPATDRPVDAAPTNL